MNRFLINCFDFKFVLKNSGRTKNKTAIKKIAGTICSNPTFNYSRNFWLFGKIF